MGDDRHFLEAMVEPQPDDSSDVRWALETAVAMWRRGNREQTLKWLHAAMTAASNEGRHDRAYALGRALSDLEFRPLPPLRGPGSAPAPGSPASTTQPLAGETRPQGSGTSRPRQSLLQTAPYRILPDEVTSHFAPDSALLQACEAPEPELRPVESAADSITDVATPEVLKVPVDRQHPPTVMTDGLERTLNHERPAPPPARDPAEHTVVMTAEELMAPSIRQGPPTTLGSPQAHLEPMRALRVAVASGEGRRIVLRLLDPGESVPAGAQEAILVPLPRAR